MEIRERSSGATFPVPQAILPPEITDLTDRHEKCATWMMLYGGADAAGRLYAWIKARIIAADAKVLVNSQGFWRRGRYSTY